jgi:hypothetical protein
LKLTNANIVYTGVTNAGVSASSGQSVGAIPIDTRMNPINIWGRITDGGSSTYAVQYTTSDVYAPGYSAAADQWTTIAGAPVTGTAPFNITALGLTAIRLNVTVGPATVTLGPVFQGDSTQGA